MNEPLLKKIHEASEHVAVQWDERRERAVLQELLQRADGRRAKRSPVLWRAAYAFAAVAVVVGIATAAVKLSRRATESQSSTATQPRSLRLDDGSAIVLASDDSSIRTLESSPGKVGIELVSGAAHFDVTHDPSRVFRVIVADVTVEVIGTAFTVERRPVGARVSVERGRVRVRWSDQTRLLSAGEAGVFGEPPTAESTLDELPGDDQEDAGAVPAPTGSAGRHVSPGEWRSLAHDGDYARAYDALRGEGPGAVRDVASELLLQADVARLSGHPEQAVAPLQRVLARHASDPQAPLAAFTLGRVLLDELKRPRDAAQAFAKVYRLSPSGALSQDALAREVEAWSRAGESGIAHDRALRYVQSYPQGRKVNAVRHYGGLE
jgi:transmembrane sensor